MSAFRHYYEAQPITAEHLDFARATLLRDMDALSDDLAHECRGIAWAAEADPFDADNPSTATLLASAVYWAEQGKDKLAAECLRDLVSRYCARHFGRIEALASEAAAEGAYL